MVYFSHPVICLNNEPWSIINMQVLLLVWATVKGLLCRNNRVVNQPGADACTILYRYTKLNQLLFTQVNSLRKKTIKYTLNNA